MNFHQISNLKLKFSVEKTFYLERSCLIRITRSCITSRIITDDGVGVVLVDHDDCVPDLPPVVVLGLYPPAVFPVDEDDGDDENEAEDGGTEDGMLEIVLERDLALSPSPLICPVSVLQKVEYFSDGFISLVCFQELVAVVEVFIPVLVLLVVSGLLGHD